MTRTWKAHRGLGFELIRVRDDDRHSPASRLIPRGHESRRGRHFYFPRRPVRQDGHRRVRHCRPRWTNTLVLVHRLQLMEQWIARVAAFLDLPATAIGQTGGGRRKPGGIVDVGVIQSLVRKGEVDDIVADYGHLVVDECHHISAVSFEAVARRAKAKYVLGLSATVTRRDGHHPIVFMQCGPVRFRTSAKALARQRPFGHRAILRPMDFTLPAGMHAERPPIQHVYAALAADEDRNDIIFDDVLKALEAGRSPILLTERKDHAHRLADRLGRFARNVLVLRGGMGTRQRREIMQRLEDIVYKDVAIEDLADSERMDELEKLMRRARVSETTLVKLFEVVDAEAANK